MYLEPDTLFDNRYRLIQLLGQGASAQVWLADDTLTGNLRVAIKIFSLSDDMDTYGAQDFQREFARVYNINHQNLLTPTNYSVSNNIPYLVLPYCENGSISSMVGRCDEADVIKLLHDVSSGLAYLHTHKVLHQDIKPDNIMIDDELNFLLTDFGISTGRDDSEGTYGGTRAYMSPERFAGRSDEKGDIWALGATAYEMLTGNPPFGDHGGLVQSQGEPIPAVDNVQLQPEMRKLIWSMLEPDPAKRPTAEEVARITGQYLENGSWKVKKPLNLAKVGAIVLAALIVIGGLVFWNITRTKTYYYKDYVEVNGAPVGIGALTGSEQRHRQASYRFEVKGGKVRRVSLVNSYGKIIDFDDAEHTNVRFPDQEYIYNDGSVSAIIVRNAFGKVMYRLEYDAKMNTASFYYDDDNHTHKFFSIGSSQSVNDAENIFESKSNIHTLMLTRDDAGRWKEIRYHSLANTPLPDVQGSYGQRFEYDEQGRIASVTSIGADGQPVGNHNGMGVRRYKYDDEDNIVEVTYFAPDGTTPSHNGNNIHLCKMDVDKYGNRLQETYFNGKNEPMVTGDSHIFGIKYEFDDHGFVTSRTGIDRDGKPMFNAFGYVTETNEPDANGFTAKSSTLDADGKPIMANFNGSVFAGVIRENNEMGQPVKITFVDEEGQPYESQEGYSTIIRTYTDMGDQATVKYAGMDGKPVSNRGFEYSSTNTYDNLGRLVTIENFDADGKLCADDADVARYALEYSPYGAVTRLTRFDAEGKPANMPSGLSTNVYLYDDMKGYLTEMQFLNSDNKLVEVDGVARMVIGYDPATSRRNQEQIYNQADRLTSTNHITVDAATGRNSAEWSVDAAGKLPAGKNKVNYEYNENGLPVRQWATNLEGKRVNGLNITGSNDKNVCEARIVYDANGNIVEATFWSADNRPVLASDGVHRRVNEYDDRSRRIHELNYDTAGKPATGKETAAEIRYSYDNRNNQVESTIYDGSGRPALSSNGVHRTVYDYDRRNNMTLLAYYGMDGTPVIPKDTDFARVTAEYDDHNNILAYNYYDRNNKLTYKLHNEYNAKHKMTRQSVLDKDNKPHSINGISVITIEYEADGRTPKLRKFLDNKNQTQFQQKWNPAIQDWGDVNGTGSSNTSTNESASGTAGWMQSVSNLASNCPTELDEGQILRSVSYTANQVSVVIKWQNVVDDYDTAEIREYCKSLAEIIRDNCNIPYSVSISVRVLNYNNSNIYTYR